MNFDNLINEVIPQPKRAVVSEQLYRSTLLLSDMLNTMVYEEVAEMEQIINAMTDVDRSLSVLESIDVDAPDFEVRLEATMNAYGITMAEADTKEKKRGFLSNTISKLKETVLKLWDKLQQSARKYFVKFTSTTAKLKDRAAFIEKELMKLDDAETIRITKQTFTVPSPGVGSSKGAVSGGDTHKLINAVMSAFVPTGVEVAFTKAIEKDDISSAFAELAKQFNGVYAVTITEDTIRFEYGYVIEMKLSKDKVVVSTSIDPKVAGKVFTFETAKESLGSMMAVATQVGSLADYLVATSNKLTKEWGFTKVVDDALAEATNEAKIKAIRGISVGFIPYIRSGTEILAKICAGNLTRVSAWMNSVEAE